MITVRNSSERGYTKLPWLDSKHTFSFAEYRDDKHIHFGPLRVINEDVVAAGQGFGTHPHRDMEIITYVIDGALEHKDSMGTGSVIKAGEVQRMTAGTGVAHSEFNHSKSQPVHFLQIWIIPEKSGIAPGYEQHEVNLQPNEWKTVANSSGGNGTLTVHQDVVVLAARINSGHNLSYSPTKGAAWLQVVKGQVTVNNVAVKAGDGAAVVDEPSLEINAAGDSEVLLFDLRT
jgi:hypothetical protein